MVELSKMTTNQFRYPPMFQIVKALAKIMMVLIPFLFVMLILSDYNLSQEEYKIMLLSIVFAEIGGMLITGSSCEIKTDVHGLYVEFFWKYLFVPWDKIKGIKYIGFRPIGYWVVLTNESLTPFHRLYALGTLPLLPSFHIHEEIESRDTLLTIIKKRISQNMKNNN